MGCFADKWDVFDINLDGVNYPGMTVEYCIGYCSRKGYSVAGVQTRYLSQIIFFIKYSDFHLLIFVNI
jgi:hypothetical protein